MTEHVQNARRLADMSLKVALARNAAEEAQWERSHTPKPREDTTERAKGGHGDPTGDIVMDERRLALREAVKLADAVVLDALDTLNTTRLNLLNALADWNGDERHK